MTGKEIAAACGERLEPEACAWIATLTPGEAVTAAFSALMEHAGMSYEEADVFLAGESSG